MKRNDNPISIYRKLVKIRDLLKDIQQLSWNITQLDKKFPLDKLKEKDYPALLRAYLEFGYEINSLAHLFREETDDEIIDELIK